MASSTEKNHATLTAMQREAARRGWVLWPHRTRKVCERHGHDATMRGYPCEGCMSEAMAWQFSLRTSHVDIAKIPDAERSERFAERLDYFADPERRRAARRAAASATDKRAAAVRSGKKAAKNAKSRPRCAKKSELRIWTE